MASEIDRERDEIFTLLAYAVTFKDWQNYTFDTFDQARGYNVGAVLVDPFHRPVFWARNAVVRTKSATQHAEVRTLNCYLMQRGTIRTLADYTLYTTLEPCAMCGSMMLLADLPRVVWGQQDEFFGGALERLMFDSSKEPSGLGWNPYPRSIRSESTTRQERKHLDEGKRAFERETGNARMGSFLTSKRAHAIFREATRAFLNIKPNQVHRSNQGVLRDAQRFWIRNVTSAYVPLKCG